MDGKVCIVTGASSGIGKAAAAGLARLGATVVLVCRDRGRGEAARRDIEAASGSPSLDLLIADLASQRAVRRAVREFKARHRRLDVLVNNAAVVLEHRQETEDGLEATYATNHLAYFLLTNLLLDVLEASAPSRVVNVTSSLHTTVTMDLDDLQSERGYEELRAYGRSKLANVMFTYELARRLEGTGVTANCLYPGLVSTNIDRDASQAFQEHWSGLGPSMVSPEKGAATVLYLASSPDVEGVTGRHFADCKPTESSPESYDIKTARRLWESSARQAGLGVTDR